MSCVGSGVAGVGSNREFANFMLLALNDVIDIHSEHLPAARRHVREANLIVIVITAAIGMGMIGYDNGLVRASDVPYTELLQSMQ